MRNSRAQFYGGVGLAVLAAILLAFSDASVAAPLTLLIVGIALIATSRRRRQSD